MKFLAIQRGKFVIDWEMEISLECPLKSAKKYLESTNLFLSYITNE